MSSQKNVFVCSQRSMRRMQCFTQISGVWSYPSCVGLTEICESIPAPLIRSMTFR